MHRKHTASGPRSLRGYRIIIYTYPRRGPAHHSHVWAESIPPEWYAVQDDMSVTRAILVRSGRKYRTFVREE